MRIRPAEHGCMVEKRFDRIVKSNMYGKEGGGAGLLLRFLYAAPRRFVWGCAKAGRERSTDKFVRFPDQFHSSASPRRISKSLFFSTAAGPGFVASELVLLSGVRCGPVTGECSAAGAVVLP